MSIHNVILLGKFRSLWTLPYCPYQWYNLPPSIIEVRPLIKIFSMVIYEDHSFCRRESSLLITLDSNKVSISSAWCWTWSVAWPTLVANSFFMIHATCAVTDCWDLSTIWITAISMTCTCISLVLWILWGHLGIIFSDSNETVVIDEHNPNTHQILLQLPLAILKLKWRRRECHLSSITTTTLFWRHKKL